MTRFGDHLDVTDEGEEMATIFFDTFCASMKKS